MSADRLGELLRRADAEAGAADALPADLPARVLRLAATHRRRRVVFCAATAMALATAMTIAIHRTHVPTPPSRPLLGRNTVVRSAPAENLQREIVHLQVQADLHLAVARRLIALREHQHRLAQLAPAAQQPDPVRQAAAQADRAAIVLIQQGDHLCVDLGLPAAAAESYRCALRAFAETPWAAVAQQRLHAIVHCRGDSL